MVALGVLGLAVFYMIRGPIDKRGGRLIQRFTPVDRYAHWLLSGLRLDFPNFDQTRWTMHTANIVHAVAAYVAISLALVHVHLGTIGMVGAYRAMRDGTVDESWAKHHHAFWNEDVVAGRSREHFVEAVPAPAADPMSRTRSA
ncbi:MAG: hypothetical protein ABI607_07180 [Betaproteobacteria bacterium]